MSAAENAGNPHYLPTADRRTARFGRDELVLLDLWGKLDQPGAVFADITWVGFTGRAVPDRYAKAFAAVAAARDAAVALVQRAAARGPGAARLGSRPRRVGGAARAPATATTSCTAPATASARSVHGNGVNMDDYETHDDRRLLPGTGFTIEPGVYFDDFGVRTEINMIVGARDAAVTGPLQTEIRGTRCRRSIDVHPQDHALLRRCSIAVASLAVGMVIASRLDLTPASSAQTHRRAADEQRAAHRRRSTRRRSATSPRRSRRWSSTSGPR